MAPSKMKAIKVVEGGKAEIQEVPLPKLRDDYVLVKVKSIALNPTDGKHQFTVGATVGCAFAGSVEEVGSKVGKAWKKGDRIAGYTHGVNAVEPEDGCFAEYAVAKGDVQMKIPNNLTDEEAATLGVGVPTVGQGLYQSLGLPLPGEGKEKIPVLIYGGSSATGSLAIQYAKLSGCEVITTCGAHNFDFVKSLGADAAFDYKDAECGAKIREHTRDKLRHCFDCISEGASPKICSDALSSAGGKVSTLLPLESPRAEVKTELTLCYTITGEDFSFGPKEFKAKPQDFEFSKMFWDLSTTLYEEGKLKVPPPKVGENGLAGVFDGLQQIREGKVSGTKLVYKVE